MKGKKIPIADAKRISEQRGCPMVLVFGIAEGGEAFCVTTYGQSTRLCQQAASMAEQFAEVIYHRKVVLGAPPGMPGEPVQMESV